MNKEMNHHSVVVAEIDTALKERAEAVLEELGISASAAVRQLYIQIALHRRIPFEVKLPERTRGVL